MAAYRADRNLPRTVTLIAAVAAALVAFLLPFVYWVQARALLQHELWVKASVKAELIGQFATRSPGVWQYQDTRLVEALQRAPAEIGEDHAKVLTHDSRVIVQVGPPLEEPVFRASRRVRDAGVPVGEVEVARSLRPLLTRTGALALLGLGLAGLVFLALRLLPLRALRAATASLAAHLRYQEKIAAFGQFALGKQDPPQLVAEAVQKVLEGSAAEAVAYLEPAPGERQVVVRALEGLAQPAETRTGSYEPDTPLGRALQGLHTVRVEGAEARDAVLPFDWARELRGALLVPVAGEEGVRGCLCVLARHGGGLDAEQAKFVESVASVLSAALRRVESETRLAFLAQFDSLTGLPNRALLRDRCVRLIAHARRRSAHFGVLFIDLDGFKLINDSLGHAAGDELLKQTAARLQACVRADDTVARNAGDEFAILLADLAKTEDAAVVAQKIVEHLAATFEVFGHEVFVTASIGIACFPNDGHDAEALIAAADAAMYRAKQLGRNGFQFFTAEINQRLRARSQLATELRQALERGELALAYQPKVELASGRACGAEALLRWRHPTRGMVYPAEFVPVLEETGLIIAAGEWVLRRACADLKEWAASGRRPVPLAVNLSARQFRQPDLEASIRSLLAAQGVEPALIEIELTESHLMHDPDEAIRVLRSLHRAGFRIAIDDFGTGYSSLSYLTRLPISALKIDRSFVKNLETDASNAAIVRTIIEMAHTLGVSVVAEGIETPEQAAFLRAQGCEYGQGYLFARPMPAAEFAAFVENEGPSAAARSAA